jgi:integrase/recombinase XerD
MKTELVILPKATIAPATGGPILPATIADAGQKASKRFIEFFTATIRNAHTRKAYGLAVADFFTWIARQRIALADIEPVHVAAYIEALTARKAAPTVKQHLAAIKMCLDWLTSGGVLDFNPAASVRGPKHIVKQGKTPVLTIGQAKALLASIVSENKPSDDADADEQEEPAREPTISELRDRALIAVMVFSFARVSAALAMKVEDYYPQGKRWRFRLHEKGGKLHNVPAHHNAEKYVDAYLEAAGIAAERKTPLFRSIDRHRRLTRRPLAARNALAMIKRRAQAIGLPEDTCCHTFRATGITAYLEGGGTIEKAQAIANHESPKTTKLYDHTTDQIDLDEIEKIGI